MKGYAAYSDLTGGFLQVIIEEPSTIRSLAGKLLQEL